MPLDGPLPILNDNVGAIQLSKNPVHHDRSKHIGLRHHFIRERVADGTVELSHVASEHNLADLLTKPLPAPAFEHLRDHIGLQPPPKQVGVSDVDNASVTTAA